MNKKIFTLLAGILLLGLFGAPSKAQTFLRRQALRVGAPVQKLKAGSNPGYYYLAIDSIIGLGSNAPRQSLDDTIDYTPAGIRESKKALVMFMGKPKNGRFKLFVDTINVVKKNG